ncbi:MAG: polysaccharide deacetylase family protein [Solirubrobacteraceae bacterium]
MRHLYTALAILVALAVGVYSKVAGGDTKPHAPHVPIATATPLGAAAPAAPVPTAAPARSSGRMFRIVGCRSNGGQAYRHGPNRAEVAIGFDDGPAPDTPAFVTMLEQSKTQATFFMIGRLIKPGYRPTLLRELRDGDVLGDLTYTHPNLVGSDEVRAQLLKGLVAIRALTGYTPCVFRPPFGAFDESVVQTAGSLGLATVLWDAAPQDYLLPGTAAIEQRILAQVRPGSIIVSHDGGGPREQTLAAYPTIIATLRARGYRIVTIPELLGFRPVYTPCAKRCYGIGVPRSQLPHDAIIQAG